MRPFPPLALLAIMVASLLVAADPEKLEKTRSDSGRTASLKAIRKSNIPPDVPSGLVRHARALTKRGSAIPEGLANALHGTTGSVNSSLLAGWGEWLSDASFGTPPQTMQVIIDTGSWDCVMFSSQSNTTLLAPGTLVYEPDNSTTAKLLEGLSFRILYGSGNDQANGDVFSDVLTIGGVTATSQAIESVIDFDYFFSELGASGLVGMALSKNNTVRPIKQYTFFDNIKDELALPVLTANLYLEAESSFDFGFINSSLIDGDITWTAVDTSNSQQGWWAIPVDGYRVGSGPFIESSFTTIMDTGTTNIFFPPALVSAYYEQVPGAYNDTEIDAFVFPCNQTLPDFDITISGTSFTIPGALLEFGLLRGGNGYTCYGTIQAIPTPVVSDLPQPTAVLGATFMLQYLTVFDLGNFQVGIAKKSFIENAAWPEG